MNINKLSKGQKKIASFIEEHYDRAAFMTASAPLPNTTGMQSFVRLYSPIADGRRRTASHEGFMLSRPKGSKLVNKSFFIISPYLTIP
jgi:hypothetical protein